MWAWLDRLGGPLLDAALAATLLSTACALGMVGCRQPARRRQVARASMVGLLALPAVSAWAPPARWDLGGALAVVAPPAGALPGWLDPGVRESAGLARGLVALYGAGLALGLGWVALGLWASRRLLRGSRPPSAGLAASYRELTAGRRVVPRLRVSDRIGVPVLVGVLRPTIVLPGGLDGPGRDEPRRLGLVHELAHAENGDPGSGLLGGLAGSLWFFLPPLWWMRAQLRLDQEFLADRAAAGEFGATGAYASTLVGLAEDRPGSGGRPPHGGGRGAGTALVSRVLMLVRCPFRVESRPPAWWRAAAWGLVGLATALASGLTLRGAGASGPSAPAVAASPHGTFRLARLTIEPTRRGPDGWPQPHYVMCTVPERFELALDVWAAPVELGLIRVAGLWLGPVETALPIEGFHRVRIARDERGVRVEVDGSEVPQEPGAAPPPGLLGFQPAPGQPGRLRDLVLSW